MSLVTISRTPKSGEPHKPDASFRLRMERLEDRDNPAATLVSSTSAFDGANAPVQVLATSDDGQEILVQSTATNLIPGQVDVPGTNDLFYFNFTNGQRSLITAAAPSAALGVTIGTKALGAEISTPGVLLKAVISGDGSAVAFTSAANAQQFDRTLQAATDDGGLDIFVWNAGTQATQLVSKDKVGFALGGFANVSSPAISRDGGTVSFISDAVNYNRYDNKYRAGEKSPAIDISPLGPNLYSAIVGQTPRLVTYYFTTFNTLDPATAGSFFVPFSDIAVDPLGRYMSAEGLSYAVISGGRPQRFTAFGTPITVTGKDAYRFTFAGVGINPPGTLNFDLVSTTVNGDAVGAGTFGSFVFDPVTKQFTFTQNSFGSVTNAIIARDRSDILLYAVATKDVTTTQTDFTTFPFTTKTVTISGNLVPGYVNNNGGGEELYLAVRNDAVASTSTYSSVLVSSKDGVNGANGTLDLTPGNFQFTPDGRRVTYTSNATDIVTGLVDVNKAPDIFQYDRISTGIKNVAISVTAANPNRTGLGGSRFPSTTTDGLTIAFQSDATNLTNKPDKNGLPDIYVRDIPRNSTSLASSVPGNFNSSNGSSTSPVIGGTFQTGRLYFQSTSTDLDRGSKLDGTIQVFKTQTPLVFNNSSRNLAYSGGPDGFVSIGTLDLDGNVIAGTKFQPYAGYTGDLRVASADVTGDGVPDIIVGAGPGGGPRVTIIDGFNGRVVDDFFAFESTFTGGVYVAAGDFNGDGRSELIVGAGESGGPRVQVYNTTTRALILDNFAYESSSRTGVHVAAGDFNGDGKQELIISPGLGGGPRVRIFDGNNVAKLNVLADFFAYDPSQRGGVYISAGDFNNDGRADIVVGTGPGVTTTVRVFNAANLILRDPNVAITFLDYQPFGVDNTDGARAVLRDIQAGNNADLVVSTASAFPHIKTFSGNTFGATGTAPAPLKDFTPFNSTFSDFGAWVG